MLESLHIKNYRLFKKFDLEKLGQVNLIAGKNNTGKTVLLEAVMLASCKDMFDILRLFSSFLIARGEFESESTKFLFTQMVNDEKLPLKINDILLKNSETGVYSDSSKSQIEFRRTREEELDALYTNKQNTFIYLPFKTNFDIRKLWENIDLTPLKKDVIKILKIIDPKIDDIGLDSINFKPKILLEGYLEPLPIVKFGDGVGRLFNIALCLVNAKNKILLLDEFDIGLHHSIQTKVWEVIFKYAKDWKIQVFATTHSRDAVKSFHEVSARTDYKNLGQYFRLQHARKTGEIEAVIYSEDSLDTAFELNLETR